MAESLYEKVKKLKEAENNGKGTGLYNYVKSQNVQLNMLDITNRLESVQNTSKKLYDSYKSRFYDENGSFINSYRGDTVDAYNTYLSKKSALDNQINYITSFLTENEKYLNPESVSSIRNYLSGHNETVSGMTKAYQSDKDYWSKWATEQDYNGFLLNDTTGYEAEDINTREEIYKSNESRIAELDKLIESFEFENETKPRISSRGKYVGTKVAPTSESQSKYDALVAERDKLKAQNTRYDQINGVYAEVKEYQGIENFSNLAAQGETIGVADYWDAFEYYTNYYNERQKILNNQDVYFDKAAALEELNAKAPKGINKLATYRHFINNYYTEDDNSSNPKSVSYEDLFNQIDINETSYRPEGYSNNVIDIIREGYGNNWDEITEEEYKVYSAKLANEGEEAAQEYLNKLQVIVDKRVSDKTSEENKKMYDEANWLEKVFLNVASVPANILGGAVGFLDDVGNYMNTGAFNPYSSGHSISQFATDVRYQTAQDLDAATGNFELLGQSLGDAYQSAMSGLDSLAGGLTFGSGYTMLMGMGAASNEAKRLYEQGASNEQIAAGGILAGAAEMIFEKISIDHFLGNFVNAPTMKWYQAVGQALIQGGIEASEEVCTEIANTLSNIAVMGSQSDWKQTIEKFKNQGYSDSEALTMAFKDLGGNVWDAFAGGLISGGLLGGGGAFINLAQNKTTESNAIKQDGANIVEFDNIEGLIAAARNLPNTKANAKLKALAEDMSGIDTTKLSKSEYKAFSNRAGKLYSMIQKANVESISSSKTDSAKATIKEKLIAKGIAETEAGKMAEVIYKAKYTNAKLSAAEDKLMNNQVAKDVANELLKNDSDVKVEAIKSQERALGQYNETASLTTDKNGSRKIDTSDYAISDDGKTYIKETDESVSITGIQSIKNGDMKVNLSNGKTESISNLDLGSEKEAVIYQGILDMGIDAKSASIILDSYDGNTDATTFIYGVQDAIKYGQIGGKAYVDSGVFTSQLTEKQRNDFYRLGEMITERKSQNKAKAIQNAIKDNKDKGKVIGAVSFDGVDRNSLTERQRVTVDAIEATFSEIGINVVFFQSPVRNGVHVGENGSYDPTTNTIRLDISAGLSGQDTILFTAAHELTHFIAEWSPEKFKTFADFLVKNYAKQGVSVDELVRLKIERSKSSKTYDKPLTYDEAFEEVVADSCESFLRDSDLLNKLTELAKKDMTLFERIKDYIDGLFERLKKAYAGLTPDSYEANEVLKMKDCIEELRNMWVDAAMEARENFQAAGGKALKNTTENSGVHLSVRQIVGTSGTNYGVGVYLDSNLLTGLTESQRKEMLKEFVISELSDSHFIAYDNNNAVDIKIAHKHDNFKNSSGKPHKVLKELYHKHNDLVVKQEAVVLIDELIANAKYDSSDTSTYSHGWLDNNGENDWDYWKVFIQEKNKTVWEATLNIANTANGEKILYDIDPIKMVEEAIKSASITTNGIIHQNKQKSQEKKSDRIEQTIATVNKTVFGESEIDVGKTKLGVKYQLRENAKIGQASINYNNRHMNVEAAILTTGVEVMHEMAEVMLPYLEEEGILPPDIPGKTIFKNGSYGRSGENTTDCVRTLTYEDFKDRVAEKIGRPLTVAESLLVSQKIYDIATDPQCIYCYVAADRKAYDEYLGEYWKAMDKNIKALRNGGDSKTLYQEYLNGRKDTTQQQKRWAMWESIAKSGKTYITAKDLTTRIKRELIIAKNNEFSKQVKDAQRYAQSASWAKTVYDYRAYKGDILKMSQKFVDMLNSEYGLRMYSFSDYTPAFIVENMQMIIDASVKGLKSLAYTKDTDYAEIFASTGQAINISCFAKYDLKTKTYVEDNRQGADWTKTKKLRNEFNNVGSVMVCTSDEMVKWALKQPWIDVIIPYHIVKTGTTIANEYGWNNYTSESSDKANGKAANIYPTEHNNSFDLYSKLINERGLTPRFSRYYAMVKTGEITKQQYMKLVNEVRLPASKLSAVKPIFNLDAAKKSFGVDNDGNVIKGGFVDKGGYMGGWYREGVDVNQEVLAVAKDIEMGKSSLDVDYGMSKASKVKVEEKYGIKRSDRYLEGMSESDQENAKKVISNLKTIAVGSRLLEGYATYTPERMDREIKNSSASGVSDYANSYITWVNPIDFVYATTTNEQFRARLKEEAGTLDIEKLQKETQPIHLTVNFETGEIVGHEGRHRMIALSEKGINKVAVIIDALNDNRYQTKPIEFMRLKGQIFDGDRQGTDFYIHDMLPLSERYADTARKLFTSKPKSNIQFSDRITSDMDADYMAAVNRGDMETAQRLVDEAAKKAGYTVEAYHGTKSDFTKFSKEKFGANFGNWSLFGSGFYFAPTKRMAEYWGDLSKENADAKVMRVFLRASKMLQADEPLTNDKAINLIKEKSPSFDKEDIAWTLDRVSRFVTFMVNKGYDANMVREFFMSMGYDGVDYSNLSAGKYRQYVVFDPEQIKSADPVTYDDNGNVIPLSERFNSKNEDIRYSDRITSYAPTFYSQMGKTISEMKQDKIGANSVVPYLKGRGVKDEEIKWSGIETFLEGKKSVTKAELQEFVAGSMLQIEENTRGGNIKEKVDTLYRAIEREMPYTLDYSYTQEYIEEKAEKFENGRISYEDLEEELYEFFTDACAEHFYPTDEYSEFWEWQDASEEWGKIADAIYDVASAINNQTKWGGYTVDDGDNYREITFEMPNSTYSNYAMQQHWGDDAQGILAHARIQDFKVKGKKMLFIEEIQSDWHNEGHKRGYAKNLSSEDAKKVAGIIKMQESLIEQAREKYSANDIDGAMKLFDKERELFLKRKKIEGNKDGIPDAPFSDNYHEFVLKRLIRMAAEQGYDSIGWTTADIQSERWSDKYAEGYRIEYDQDMPKFLNKYGKKWGAKVGTTMLENGKEVWSMDLTDSMKNSVLHEGQVMFQARPTESISNRSLLANALESTVQNDIEKNKLTEYKNNIERLNAEEQKLIELRKQINEMQFAKGKRDAATQDKLRKLRDEALRSANRISLYDKKLLTLEASKPLKNVLDREKAKAVERQKERDAEAMATYRRNQDKKIQAIKEQYQESRSKAVEGRHRTEIRNKIKRVVNDLNQYLLRGTKEKHVMIGLQKSVAMALDAVNMDTVGADERVAKYNALISKATDPDVIASLTETRDRIQMMGDRMSDKLDKLKSAYEEIKNSDDPDVANAYDEVIDNAIKSVIADVGDTSLRDMTYAQLESVYDLYTMILTRVRDANKSFKSAKNEDIRTRGENAAVEVKLTGGVHHKTIKGMDGIKGFGWNTLKPTYAFDIIGSNTLTEAYENVRSGEDTWATDVNEAKQFYQDTTEKYAFDSWDFKKRHTFTSTSGIKFELSLEQIMSLYAYSKRKQADQHLKYGGFVFDEAIEIVEKKHGIPVTYTVNTANAHNLSLETLSSIISTLSDEQRQFVDEMQQYLSTVMGAKGNEVSLAMYGVKLFKEKFYFPLKSAKQFLFEQNQTAGEVRIKNAGFTKDVVPEAKNPVILSNFTDVWSNHVNDMAMYHSFVLALEDFNRIFNYKTPVDEKVATHSVKQSLQNAYGKSAVDYIKQLITDLNGGARVDSTTGILNKAIGKFKKASVFASASVVIQQPSAIGRAFAIIDPKYFATNPGIKGHKALWDEVKKYAPVAIIKEMGYFDTHVGKQTTEWIKAKEYNGIKDKAKALVTDSGYRDEILSKAPALADELAWSYIWQAVKKEMAATTNLQVGSEEFLQRCGKRFTEVVTKTQVYDSVLARSGMMRSNDTGMKMVTAFMAEPTTSLNMLTNALIQGKRGNKKFARKAVGGVVTSMILNSILVSLIYAARDDDDDETYLEKYISALSGQLVDSVNPLTLIPWVKDIWSIVQGYDVERSDMSVVSDLWNAFSDLSNDNKSAYRKVEDFAGAVCSVFGLPIKNIMRDARSIYTVIDGAASGNKTTWAGIEDAIIEGVTGNDVTSMERAERLFNRGDTKSFNKTVSEMVQSKVDDGKTEKEAKSSVRSSFTSRYKKQYVSAAKSKNSTEMISIRKLLHQTGLYGTLTELDETLKNWRTE